MTLWMHCVTCVGGLPSLGARQTGARKRCADCLSRRRGRKPPRYPGLDHPKKVLKSRDSTPFVWTVMTQHGVTSFKHASPLRRNTPRQPQAQALGDHHQSLHATGNDCLCTFQDQYSSLCQLTSKYDQGNKPRTCKFRPNILGISSMCHPHVLCMEHLQGSELHQLLRSVGNDLIFVSNAPKKLQCLCGRSA